MGKNYKLVVGISEDGEIIEMEFEENRFDPFEALDTFLACIREMEEHTVGFGGDIETMRNQVYALRAYITGVEKFFKEQS